jgi:hypothetical protein
LGAYLIYNDQTDGTGVTPATTTVPQVIKTWTLDQSDAFLIMVIAVFRITGAGSGAPQVVNPTITIGTNVRTFAYNSKVAADDDYITAVYMAESRAGDVVTAQLNASAGADANTTVNVKTFQIFMVGP